MSEIAQPAMPVVKVEMPKIGMGPIGLSAGAGAGAGAVVGSILTALIAGYFGYMTKVADPDPKVTETAINILQSKPTPEMASVREWAVNVLSERAKPPLTDAQKRALLSVELPKAAK